MSDCHEDLGEEGRYMTSDSEYGGGGDGLSEGDGEQDRRAVGPRLSTGRQECSSEGDGDGFDGYNGCNYDERSDQGGQQEAAGGEDEGSLTDASGPNSPPNVQSEAEVEETITDRSFSPQRPPRANGNKATSAVHSALTAQQQTAEEEEFHTNEAALRSPSSNGGGWRSNDPSLAAADRDDDDAADASDAGEAEGGVLEGEGGDRGGFSPRGERPGIGTTSREGALNSMSFQDDDSDHLAPSDIMQHISAVSGRDREAQAVIDALQEVYLEKLKPIEELSLFEKFHHDVMAGAELQAKPQVLLLGQYSTGKTSMIRHLIGRDFPAMNIGPEPSSGVFQVVMAGSEERTAKGSALCIVDELPYAGLGKFGAPFLGKFQASIVPAPLLDHITFVDTPGILTGENRVGRRGYPFPEVVKWFADRSDLILLVFDAHKLDMGEEFREVMKAIAHVGDRVRVVLNKAQEVDGDRLVKVYGALMWAIGRCLRGRGDPPKVYVGSFWGGPRRHPDDSPEDDDSFDVDEAALRREMMELPKNGGVRKINDMMQRARLVKTHLQIMYAVRARMPRLWGAEAAQDRILANLEEVFEEVKTQGGVKEADMPSIEEYRRDLGRIDFRDLPRRNRRLLATIDDVIDRDIKQCVTRAGGVRRLYKLDSAARIHDVLPPPSSSSRRATMGGASARGPGPNLFSRQGSSGGGARNRRATTHDRMQGWSPRTSEGGSMAEENDEHHPEDSSRDESLVLPGGGVDEEGARGGRGGDNEVPFLLGTMTMVLVILVGVAVGLWKMDAIPDIPLWALSLKPGGSSPEIEETELIPTNGVYGE